MSKPATESSIERLLAVAAQSISSLSDTAKLDAELLMCHVLQCNQTYLFTWPEKSLEQSQEAEFRRLVAERLVGKPIAHLIGKRHFWDLDLAVNDTTLIPRPDTELMVEQVLSIIEQQGPEQGTGLDLGTGTGAIALSLANNLPHWQWLGVDIVPEAVALAESNALRNHIDNCKFKISSWFSELDGKKFDFIVSNPPYIDRNDPHLSQGDVRYEPLSALVADEHGFSDLNTIAKSAQQYLLPGGKLMVEHGYEQGTRVRQILTGYNFQNVETFKDLSGNDRVSIGYF